MTATLLLILLTPGAELRPELIVVQGAGGAPEYAEQFSAWCDTWETAGERAETLVTRIGGSDADGPLEDREQLAAALKKSLAKPSSRPLWLVLIGHGTHDGREARFNLHGPDFTDEWLQKELESCQRPLAVVCCFSSSAPFLNRLSKPGRSVITATRSGAERNFSRFGGFLAEAISGIAPASAGGGSTAPDASEVSMDLDKDGQVSLLEAFLYAAQRTEQFYADEQRLATEHPLVDDNGDQRGTPADWFHGIRPTKSPAEGAMDGLAASQQVLIPSERERQATAQFLQQRDAVEQELASLRKRRGELSEDVYYQQLEPLMVKLARLYAELGSSSQ